MPIDDEDDLEFNPPESASSNIISNNLDDNYFFLSGISPSDPRANPMNSGFYGNWDDDDDDLFMSCNRDGKL